MNKTIAHIILIIIIFLPIVALAQPGSGVPGDPGEPEVPIDGGASLLVGAAALYGIRKMRDKRKAAGK